MSSVVVHVYRMNKVITHSVVELKLRHVKICFASKFTENLHADSFLALVKFGLCLISWITGPEVHKRLKLFLRVPQLQFLLNSLLNKLLLVHAFYVTLWLLSIRVLLLNLLTLVPNCWLTSCRLAHMFLKRNWWLDCFAVSVLDFWFLLKRLIFVFVLVVEAH